MPLRQAARVVDALSRPRYRLTILLVTLVLCVAVLYGWAASGGAPTYLGRLTVLFVVALLAMPILIRFGMKGMLWSAVLLFWVPFPLPMPGAGRIGGLDRPSELLVYLLLGLVLLNAVQLPMYRRSISAKLGIGKWLLLAYVGTGVWSLVWHELTPFAMQRFRIAVLYPAAIIVVCSAILQTQRDAERLIHLFLLSLSSFAAFLLVGYSTSSFTSRPDSLGGERLSAEIWFPGGGLLIVGEAILASNIAVAFPFALLLWTRSKTRLSRLLGGVAVVISGLILVYTQGRGGWIGAAAATIVVVILSLRFRGSVRWGTIGKAAGLLVFGYLAILMVANRASSAYLERTLSLFSDPLSDFNFISRQDNWLFHWLRLLRYPQGVGWEATYDVYYAGAMPYPHNAFLLFGSAMGWPGMLSYIGILAWLAWYYWRSYRRGAAGSPLAIAGLAGIVAWLLTGMAATTGIYDAYGAGMVWWPAAIALAAATLSTGTEETGPME